MKKRAANLNLIPIVIVLGYIPLIVHMTTYNTGYERFEWFADANSTQADFFLSCKAFALMITCIVMAVVLIYNIIQNKKSLKFDVKSGLILAYTVLSFFSAVFGGNMYFAFRGGYEMFESIWVVLCYMMVCFYCYQTIEDREQLTKILKWSSLGYIVLLLLCFFQYLGLDFFKTTVGKMLITSPSYWSNLEGLSFTFMPHIAYGSLYNPDYLAFYYGMFIPILVGLSIVSKKKYKPIFITVAVISVLNLAASTTIAGWIALFGVIILAMFVLLSRNWKNFFIALIGFLLLMSIGIYLIMSSSIGEKVKAVVWGTASGYDNCTLQSMETKDDCIVLNTKDESLSISYTVDLASEYVELTVLDGNGNPLTMNLMDDSYSYCFEDSRFEGWKITPVYIGDYICLDIEIDNLDWYFTNQIDGSYYYNNAMGKFVKTTEIESAKLFNDDFFGNRGIIWNYTLPLLKKHIILGSGANTFALEYPQNDYVHKKYANTELTYDVKPHSWYLQSWVEQGLLATLCIIVFYIIYFIQSILLYRNIIWGHADKIIGFSIFLGTVAYMIVALANDSNVCTAPVFWAILGIGNAWNNHVIKLTNCKL